MLAQTKKEKAGNLFAFSLGDLMLFIVGEIQRINIGHDNSGAGPAWFLDHVIIRCEEYPDKEWRFPVNRWFSKNEDDGAVVREIQVGGDISVHKQDPMWHYKITVYTGDVKGAGTDANVFISMTGDKV